MLAAILVNNLSIFGFWNTDLAKSSTTLSCIFIIFWHFIDTRITCRCKDWWKSLVAALWNASPDCFSCNSVPCCPHRLLCPRLRAIPEAVPHSSWSDCSAHSDPPEQENHSEMFHYLWDDDDDYDEDKQAEQSDLVPVTVPGDLMYLLFNRNIQLDGGLRKLYLCSYRLHSRCRDCCNDCWHYSK